VGQKRRSLEDAPRVDLPHPESYYDLYQPLRRRVEIWHTIYNHVMAGPKAIVEWFQGSALRLFFRPLMRPRLLIDLEAYTAEIARHYPARSDGQTLLRFPWPSSSRQDNSLQRISRMRIGVSSLKVITVSAGIRTPFPRVRL
jgi:trans-aconitate methyltransferase